MATFKHHLAITDDEGNFYFESTIDGDLFIPFLYGHEGQDIISDTEWQSALFAPQSSQSRFLGPIQGGDITSLVYTKTVGDEILALRPTIRRISPEDVMHAICDRKIDGLESLAVISIISATGAVQASGGA